MCVSHKSISWNSYTFFILTLTVTLTLTLNPNPNLNPNTNNKPNVNPNPYPSLTLTLTLTIEINILSNKVIIFQSKAATEKRKTVLISNYTLTYLQQQHMISEKHMCISKKSISWNSHTFKITWLSFKVKRLQRKGTLF